MLVPSPPPRHGETGFSLLEVLVAIAIVSITVFPLLQISQESQAAAFDAKFSEVATSRIRSMLSHITAHAHPGDTAEGNFSSMSEEEGFVDEFSYDSIRYEWEVEAMDLSLDLLPEEDDEEADPYGTDSDDVEDDEIDDRFRARWVKITVFYLREDGQERELTVETFLPPLPKDDTGYFNPDDLVPPNNG